MLVIKVHVDVVLFVMPINIATFVIVLLDIQEVHLYNVYHVS